MNLFGKSIEFQKHSCSGLIGATRKLPPFVNLYVKVTNGCNAYCRFCSNSGSCNAPTFNLPKLFDCIEEINRSGIRLNRICLTGGEPSLCYDRVNEIIKFIESHSKCLGTQLQLNTNGLSVDAQRLMRHNRLDVISVSLHHYDRGKLEEIYGCTIDTEIANYPGVNPRKLNVSCNLIRGYIDNADEVRRYLDFVATKGIRTVGFVSLMKVSNYCREKFIDYSEIDFGSIANLILMRERHHETHCKCSNYIYRAENGKMVEVYMRENLAPEYCASSLLFDGDFLRQGFNNDNIIY